MTNGQLQQLQALSKCYMEDFSWDERFVDSFELVNPDTYRMDKNDKAYLRRLTHLYRHQIAAIKRNQS